MLASGPRTPPCRGEVSNSEEKLVQQTRRLLTHFPYASLNPKTFKTLFQMKHSI